MTSSAEVALLRLRSWFTGKALLGALLLVAISGGWFVTELVIERGRDGAVPETRKQLLVLLDQKRPFEGRLLGMPYGKFEPGKAGLTPSAKALQAARKLLAENQDVTEAGRLSYDALLLCLGGQINRAIQNLVLATQSRGSKAWMWGELAALYMERFRRQGDSQDLLKSLDVSSRAQGPLTVALEAQFNYALTLEKLSLLELASKAWKDYIALDPNSAWAGEARDHLKELNKLHLSVQWNQIRERLESADEGSQGFWVQAAAREFPQSIHEYAEEDLLGRWGVKSQEGHLEEARRALSLARHIGKELAVNGEHTVEDAVAAIDQATSVGDRQLVALARSHALYQQALSASKNHGCSVALALFEEAGRGLEAEGSPFFRWAWLRSALCEYRSFNYASAQDILERMLTLPRADRYPVLTGNVEWILGLTDGLQGDLAGTLTHYRRSLDAFTYAKEEENRSSLLSLTAECLKSLGDSRLAWEHSWRSLQTSPRILNARRKYSVLSEASNQAQGLDLPEAALRIMDEAILTISGPDTVGQISALRLRAGLCLQVDRVQEARESILAAQKLLPKIADSYTRSALQGDLLAIEGQALAGTDPEAAKAQLSRAIDDYRSTSYVLQLGNLLLERGQIEASLHQLDLAEEDLANAIQLVEEGREKAPAKDRESFLDRGAGSTMRWRACS